MHLECRRDHRVRIDGDVYRFEAGETIHTENSYKYSIAEFHGRRHGPVLPRSGCGVIRPGCSVFII